MLNKDDFLKLIGTMTQQELDQYWTDIQRWNDEVYPRLCALTDAWTDCDIKDYKEGIRLASALRSAREFCSQPMAADAVKRLKRIRYYMNEVDKFIKRNKLEPHIISAVTEKRPLMGVVAPLPTINESGEAVPSAPVRRYSHKDVVNETSEQGKFSSSFHPDHLSDYIQRLSPQLQKESLNLQTWYLELSEYHYVLEKLVSDKRSSQADRRYYARLVTKIENKILSFYHRVNAEWEELNGKRVSSEVKKELEQERRSADISTVNEGGSMPKTEIDELTDKELRERLTKQRIKRNIRYLAERSARSDAPEQMRIALQEMKEWGQLITAMTAGKLKEWYGIDVDPDQIEPQYTPEEKEAIRKEKRRIAREQSAAKRKEQLTKTKAEREAQARIRKEERMAKHAAEKEAEKERYREIARSMGADDDENSPSPTPPRERVENDNVNDNENKD